MRFHESIVSEDSSYATISSAPYEKVRNKHPNSAIQRDMSLHSESSVYAGGTNLERTTFNSFFCRAKKPGANPLVTEIPNVSCTRAGSRPRETGNLSEENKSSRRTSCCSCFAVRTLCPCCLKALRPSHR